MGVNEDRIGRLEERFDRRFEHLEERVDSGFERIDSRLDDFISANNERCDNHMSATQAQFAEILKKISEPGKRANAGIAQIVGAPWFKVLIGLVVSAVLGYLGYDMAGSP